MAMEAGTLVRKLSAIVSADVAGYSRLMAEDEAETVEEVRLLVGQYRGRLADFTGDNFLAEFPTATDAVACALEIHRVVEARNAGLPLQRRMHFRIGVHLGEVTLEDERLYGDGVNIAARLEGLAPPGGICISATVHDQVKKNEALSFDDLGPHELKNIPDPVRVYRVRPEVAVEVAPPSRQTWSPRVLASLALAGLGLMALGLAIATLSRSPSPEGPPPSHFRLDVLGDGSLSNGSFPPVAIAPDGRSVVYTANTGDTTQLFLRSLDGFEATPLTGTEGAVSPFFSPDGSWVGFFVANGLHKVRTSGGAPVRICETSNNSFPSGHWGTDGIIRYSRGMNVSSGLMHVSSAGGKPEPLTTPDFDSGERWHGLPQRLPGGEVLFTVSTSEGYRAGLLSADSQKWAILEGLGPAVAAHYQPSGHIVFGQPGRLMVAAWGPAQRESGTPASVLQGIHTSRFGVPYFAMSESGTLVYAPGGVVHTTPVLLDREGRATPVADDPGAFQHPRFSPDDRSLAVDITWRGRTDIYVYDLLRGTRRRLTHTGFNIDPLFTLDGSNIVFRSTRRAADGTNIYRVAADGSGQAELLMASEKDKVPGSWARDGTLLVYTDISPTAQAMDIGTFDLDTGAVDTLIPSPYNVGWPVFSPSENRIAYVSDESGRMEIWVRPFPGSGPATQVSIDGGSEPVWSPEGAELYFRRGTSFFAVALEGAEGLRPGAPREMFRGRYDLSPTGHQHFDISNDHRFAAIALDQAEDPQALHLILDWGQKLDRLVAGAD
ncbi:MAG: PD40 domain-containing protein [Deltaproteobacteria bacterium]|nr:PD40 domain-containing protein [Deltaproteobacteria bacterium]